MRQKRWTDMDIKVSPENSQEFEEWCDSNGVRYTTIPPPVPNWNPPVALRPVISKYRVWCKWPDKIMLCKLTWAGL
jgi:hypothetical protein